MQSTRYSCQILVTLKFSQQIFEKYSNMKFHENPSSGSQVVLCGETNRRDEVDSRFSKILRNRLKTNLPLKLLAD